MKSKLRFLSAALLITFLSCNSNTNKPDTKTEVIVKDSMGATTQPTPAIVDSNSAAIIKDSASETGH